MWNIDKLSEPYTYLAHEDQKYIKFKTDDTFNGLEIDVSSFDMTNDGVIFIPNSGFPRYEDDDFAIIGFVRLYDGNVFLKEVLIAVYVLDSNVENPLDKLQMMF